MLIRADSWHCRYYIWLRKVAGLKVLPLRDEDDGAL